MHKHFHLLCKLVIAGIVFCMSTLPGKAQYYDGGQDPASIKWRRISTDHFQLIYPENFEKRSQELINTMEYVYDHASTTLNDKPKKVPIIIHNRSVTANAFSIWAPKRMEFYSCPPQNSYAQDWMQQLAIHEFRHTVQMDKLNQGFTKYFSYLTGQQGTALVLGLFIPMWLMEGDAVCTETALSHSGRGRTPNFEMEFRAQLLEKKRYSYDKAVYGSYKDYIPDIYVLGYPLVATARKRYGAQIWEHAENTVARYPFLLTPFNKALKQSSGMHKVNLYKSILNELDSLWTDQYQKTSFTPYNRITRTKKNYTKYKYPHYMNDSTFVAERSGIDDICRIVCVDRKGHEKILFTPGLFSTENISVSNGFAFTNKPGSYAGDNLSIEKGIIIWTEKETDIRWENKNYSVIKSFDIKTKKIKQLTHKSRYFAPSLSPDGSSIVAVDVSEDNIYSLVLINPESGEKTKELLTSENNFYMTPSWSEDGKKIVVIMLNNQGKSIATINPATGNAKTILQPSFVEISNPTFYKNYIFYNAAYSGIDNIYAIDTLNQTIYQVTSAPYGSYNADISIDGEKMIFSNYSADGYAIAESNFDPTSWKPLSDIRDNSIKLYKALLKQESGMVDSSTIPKKQYISEPYSKLKHLINIHSWAPASIDINNTSVQPGVSVMSQNALSTMFATLGYEYSINEETGKYYADLSYRGFFPIIDLRIEHGERAGQYENAQHGLSRLTWTETSVNPTVRVPLNFSEGNYFKGIQPAIGATYISTQEHKDAPAHLGYHSILSMNYQLFAYHQIKSIEKDMFPKWKQDLTINYRHTPFDKNENSIACVEGNLYFPGIIKHHGIKIYGGVQQNSYTSTYRFSDFISMPRSYIDIYANQLYSAQFNYKFPVMYPDLTLGSLLYIKRIKCNLFYDYMQAHIKKSDYLYRSTGVELTSDLHFLRLLTPLNIGVRGTYNYLDQEIHYEFLFTMNFNIF